MIKNGTYVNTDAAKKGGNLLSDMEKGKWKGRDMKERLGRWWTEFKQKKWQHRHWGKDSEKKRLFGIKEREVERPAWLSLSGIKNLSSDSVFFSSLVGSAYLWERNMTFKMGWSVNLSLMCILIFLCLWCLSITGWSLWSSDQFLWPLGAELYNRVKTTGSYYELV